MVFRWFQAVVAVLVLGLLSSCSQTGRHPIERPLYYDVRDVAVIADARVSQVMLAGIDRRVAEAIGATVRPVPLPRVILAINILDYAPGGLWNDRRPRVTFKVVATSVDNGMDLAAGTFTVFAATNNFPMIDESLAEEVAARIRFAFSLSTPQVVRRERPRPASAPRVRSEVVEPAAVAPATRPAPAEHRTPRQTPVQAPVVTPRQPVVEPVTPAPPAAPAPIPPVVQPSAPQAAPVPTAPATPSTPSPNRPAQGAAPSGTNIEEGANGAIRLPGDGPTCDPTQDPECQVPEQ